MKIDNVQENQLQILNKTRCCNEIKQVKQDYTSHMLRLFTLQENTKASTTIFLQGRYNFPVQIKEEYTLHRLRFCTPGDTEASARILLFWDMRNNYIIPQI